MPENDVPTTQQEEGAAAAPPPEEVTRALHDLLTHYIEHLSICSGGLWSAEDDARVRDAVAVLDDAGLPPALSPDTRARLRRR